LAYNLLFIFSINQFNKRNGGNMQKREQWGSRLGFILAALGMAVGTGSIWRFPRLVGMNDGGSFIIAYTICNIVWVVPLLMIEMGIGKTIRLGAIGSFRDFYNRKKTWFGGWISFVCAAITFYYAVVFGYALRYFVYSVSGTIKPGFDSHALWNSFISSPSETITFQAIALVITGLVIYRGVKGGLEKVSKIAIPSLFILLFIAAVWSISQLGSSIGLKYLFVPKFPSLLKSEIWISALTQAAWAAWAAGAGWAMMLTYSNYFKKNEDVTVNSFLIAFGTAAGSLLSALAILPAVFALSSSNAEAFKALAAGNYGLAFEYLAKLFTQLPGGRIFSSLFFLALSLSALTSIIPQTEVIVRNLINAGYKRHNATIIVIVGLFIFGLPSAYSIDILNNQDWVWGIGLLVSCQACRVVFFRRKILRLYNIFIDFSCMTRH
jgi:neurotransmitter:Na+ symporter, NSS family